MFRRLLKYRIRSDLSMQQQNTHFPTTRIPISAIMNNFINHPLADSTNVKNNMVMHGNLRMSINPTKMINSNINEEFNESNFESHHDGQNK